MLFHKVSEKQSEEILQDLKILSALLQLYYREWFKAVSEDGVLNLNMVTYGLCELGQIA